MRFIDVAIAILAAFLLQTVMSRYFGFLNSYVDLFTVIAAAFGLLRGRMNGMVTGTCAGLLQDAFSGVPLGFNGIAKTAVGYLAGIAGRRLIIRGWSTRLLFFMAATVVDLAILAAVGEAIELPRVSGGWSTGLYLCLGNALAGILLVRLIERRPPAEGL